MNFTRKTLRGQNKEWYDESGEYRLSYHTEYDGVAHPPVYYACVRSARFDGEELWDFAAMRESYKSYKAAEKGAKANRKSWDEFFKIAAGPYKGRADKLRALRERSTVGTGAEAHVILQTIPLWVWNKADNKTRKLLLGEKQCEEESAPSPSTGPQDHTATLKIGESISPVKESPPRSSGKTKNAGPAPTASGRGSKPNSQATVTTSGSKTSSNTIAPSAAVVVSEPKKKAKSSTPSKSKSGSASKKKSTTTI